MKSYIIHLSKIESSLASALRLQDKLLTFGMESELFEGSYGNVTFKHYNNIGRKHHPWTFKGPDKPCGDVVIQKESTPGVMGCFDAHYRAWQLCIEKNEPIIIFEDDADPFRPYIPVEFNDVLSLVFSHKKKTQKYRHLLDPSPPWDPAAITYSSASMPGNAGYAIKPHAAKKLVEMYKNTFLPADNAINQHVVHIQVHNHAMGIATPREATEGKSSLIRTRFWSDEC